MTPPKPNPDAAPFSASTANRLPDAIDSGSITWAGIIASSLFANQRAEHRHTFATDVRFSDRDRTLCLFVGVRRDCAADWGNA